MLKNQSFGSRLTHMAGPTIGTIDDAMGVLSKIVHGKKFGKSLYYLIKSNLPYANLIYTKSALDYLIGYKIQEAISPGSIRKMINRNEEEGDEYFLQGYQA